MEYMGHDLAETCIVSCKPLLLLTPLDSAWRNVSSWARCGEARELDHIGPRIASVSTLMDQNGRFGTTMQVPAVRRCLVACSLIVSEKHRITVSMGGARDVIEK
jgi:hypothetical protein